MSQVVPKLVLNFEFLSKLIFCHPFLGGAEIISIDAVNKSKDHDDFVVGITIIKVLFILTFNFLLFPSMIEPCILSRVSTGQEIWRFH